VSLFNFKNQISVLLSMRFRAKKIVAMHDMTRSESRLSSWMRLDSSTHVIIIGLHRARLQLCQPTLPPHCAAN
jgi:hypothetical protein